MSISIGPLATPPSEDGSGPTSPENVRGDALLSSTLDEIADVFQLGEAFPYKEVDDAEEPIREVPKSTRRGMWRRIANWCFGGAAGRGT